MEGDEDHQEKLGNQPIYSIVALNIPVFVRKLWKMVNDKDAEDIIGWNSTGNGFIIYDQIQFITVLLPQYFKHNHLASFIRQLNFYDFHKVVSMDKDELHFTHGYFLKDSPELLGLIKRKCPSRSSREIKEHNEEISSILDNVKDMKIKQDLVTSELKKIKQENALLWMEINSLRIKQAKQNKVINKLLHFLISFVQTSNRSVNKTTGRIQLNKGPKIVELDCNKTGLDTCSPPQKKMRYTITAPNLNAIAYKTQRNSGNNELSKISNATTQFSPQSYVVSSPSHRPEENQICNVSTSSNSNIVSPSFSIVNNPKEDLELHIENTEMEIDSIQDMLKTLSPNDMTNFYDLIDENYEQEQSDKTDQSVTNRVIKELQNELTLPVSSEAETAKINNAIAANTVLNTTTGGTKNDVIERLVNELSEISSTIPQLEGNEATTIENGVPEISVSTEPDVPLSQALPENGLIIPNENVSDINVTELLGLDSGNVPFSFGNEVGQIDLTQDQCEDLSQALVQLGEVSNEPFKENAPVDESFGNDLENVISVDQYFN